MSDTTHQPTRDIDVERDSTRNQDSHAHAHAHAHATTAVITCTDALWSSINGHIDTIMHSSARIHEVCGLSPTIECASSGAVDVVPVVSLRDAALLPRARTAAAAAAASCAHAAAAAASSGVEGNEALDDEVPPSESDSDDEYCTRPVIIRRQTVPISMLVETTRTSSPLPRAD